jgi:hypothetical protein
MVDIARLAAPEQPPRETDWLWITRNDSGRYRCEGSASLKKELETAPHLSSSVPEDDLNVLIERAREWAGARNIATLYLSE